MSLSGPKGAGGPNGTGGPSYSAGPNYPGSGYARTEEETTLADIASVEDVASRGPSARVILLSLLGASVGIAAIVVGGGWAIGAISHTEAGFCGRVTTPCTSLSLESVEKYAGINLPAGSDVQDAYFLDWTDTSMVRDEVPADAGFTATVRLPAGDADPLAGSDYLPYPELPAMGVELPSIPDDLSDVTYALAIGDSAASTGDPASGDPTSSDPTSGDPTGVALRIAVSGIDADGRRVYAFRAGPVQ